MRYLNDTCVFLHKISTDMDFFDIVAYVNKCNELFCITDVVYEEIKPGIFIEDDNRKKSKELCNCIDIYRNNGHIEFIEINKNSKYQKNYEDIRKKYYGHLYDRKQLKKYVDSGEYSIDEVKRLKYKDCGECSCLAVAMENPEFYTIISDDKGLITLKPDTNIFKIFERKHKVKIYKYETWVEHIRYKKRNKR